MAAAPQPEKTLVGAWGGDHVGLELTAQGGRIEFDCAHGELSAAVTPDRDGRFDVPGRYIPERGGPVREGETSSALPVRYSGRVSGDRMRLDVARTDARERLGSFTLERGREPNIMKCR